MKVKKILFERRYKAGYIYRREIWSQAECDTEMRVCYNLKGEYIGNPRIARFLCVKRGIQPFKARKEHSVCSIGFQPREKKWYGWSHRAICGFGVGDRIFEERFGNDKTPFVKHGRKKVKTLADAKLAAKRFAAYVS